ncbi:molybdopterin cofactor-binding domain-containing protein [Actinomadura sp. SCN-SB]|uniref:xanthine dehydrogenase family protein molybdopterin-binding subunit n=1 Tax=Actinomadura sp. SCN-SB TaxID=3373092 RepID=UPI003753BF9F
MTGAPVSRHVTVGPDGTIEVRVGKVEIGQGIVTALSQIAADTLGVPPERIRMLPASTRYGPNEGFTAGSLSIATSGPALRAACAQARALFVAEAARRWEVGPGMITVRDGRLSCGDLTTSYGELAESVDLGVPVDPDAAAGAPAEPTGQIGGSLPRLDLPAKVAGRPAYLHDLRLPGQLFGRVLRPPSPGARLLRYGASRLDPQVTVVRDGSFLGVVAADEAAATRALATLRDTAEWDERDTLPDENDLHAYLRSGPHRTIETPTVGEPPATGRRLRARYGRPFIAHASMAPSCAAARWNDDGTLSVWTHSQGIHPLRTAIAGSLGLEESRVHVDHVDGAGCYGHNAADDAAFDAVLLARAVPGRPVLVQWTRQDELTWAPFGSAMSADVSATLDEATGRVTSWEYELWSQGHAARPGFAGAPGLLAGAYLENPLALPAAADPPLERGGGSLRNAVPIYAFPHRRVTGHRLLETPIRSSALRSLGAFMNVFAIESFMDELAGAAGADPLEFRLAHLTDDRARAVLERAAEAAGWGTPPPFEDGGRGLGFAQYKNAGAYCAVVADVEAGRRIRARRLTIAVDVGRVVNPDGVRNQIEGGAVQATSWTLKERVRFDRRRITSGDWESYPILRFSETPHVTVDIVEHPGTPSVGAGEAAQGPTAAALANAVADALDGVRVRDLPLTPEAVMDAING